MSEAVQTLAVIFCSRLELKKVQTALSEHLETLPKIWVGGNSARVWVKTASSAAIIFFLVYSVMWCGAYVKCYMACSGMVLWLTN